MDRGGGGREVKRETYWTHGNIQGAIYRGEGGWKRVSKALRRAEKS
jgi:hypothetical protein